VGFLAPIAGLVAGVVGSVLVIVYWMLKLRRRPVKVSSTLLWKKSVRDLEGNIPWQMVRPSVLLLLQLIAVVLLAIAIARPVRDAGLRYGGEVVVIVDAGASMNAIADSQGRTRLDVSKRDAIELVRTIGGRSAEAKFRVIRAAGSPRLVSGASGSWRQARAAIESIDGSDLKSDLNAAVGLVASLEIDESQDDLVQVFAFTDAMVEDGAVHVRPPLTEIDDRDGRGNLGVILVGAQRDQADAVQCRVFVTVAGVVEDAVGARIAARVWGMDDRVLASRALELIPDDDGLVESAATLSFRLDSAAVLEVSLSRDDVLDADNRVWVSLPDPSPVVTTVVAPEGVADPLLVDVLSAATGGLVSVVGQGEPVASGTGLMVYDRVERDARVVLPTIEIGIGARAESTMERVLTWDRSHPAMRDVDLSGLRFSGGGGLDGTPLASGRGGAVIAETANRGIRHLAVGFALEDSNWGVQVSMPMFFANAVRHLLPGTSGTGGVYKTGEPIGETGGVGGVVDRVGVVTVEGEAVGVSLLDRGSTIRAGQVLEMDMSDAEHSGGFDQASGAGRVELWRWFVLAGLVVLTIEWTLDLLRRRIV